MKPVSIAKQGFTLKIQLLCEDEEPRTISRPGSRIWRGGRSCPSSRSSRQRAARRPRSLVGWAIALKLFYGTSLILTPLPLLAAMLFLIGCMSILMGLLAEMVMRTYFESQSRPSYHVRQRINLDTAS